MAKEENKNSKDTIKVYYGGTSFRNIKEVSILKERQATIKMYPLINTLPTLIFDLIIVFAFGVLGSITNLFKQIAYEKKKIEDLNYISEPILGMLTGFIIIGLSYLIPNTLAVNDIVLKPMSLMFLSLFSGFFSIKFYSYLNSLFGKIFKEDK